MVNYLQIENLTKSFGDLILFENLSFSILEGEKIGLIAPNGSGKTTLLNIIAGKEDHDSGSLTFKRDLKIGYLPQDPHFPSGLTVLQACFYSDNETVQLIADYEKAMSSGNHSDLAYILPEMDRLKAWDYEQKAKQILSQLKISHFEQQLDELSGGQLKRVALANVLITEPDLFILDEPTNHLDLEMTEWLETYLNRSSVSILMVTHDRYFLDRVCNEIIEIENRQLWLYRGNYTYFLEKREERMIARNTEVDRANNLFRKELEWMRRQPQARATKAKARIDAFYDLEKKASQNFSDKRLKLDVKASYIGNKIFEAKEVSKSWGNLKVTDHFNYTFARYEKLGIVGNNGTGKSTFIKMLIGEVHPDSGCFEIGDTVNFGYYSQDGLQFDEQMKVIDVVQNIAEVISVGNDKRLTASQFLQHFLFSPEKQHNYVYKLSGGEKRRLYLCTVLIKNPNFLILDEPTNDLDILTLNMLEEYLQSFKGCIIVVSHDRYFMDKIVDHILVFQGNANIKDFPGNYTDYREWKEARNKQERLKETSSQKDENQFSSQQSKNNENRKRPTYNEKKEFESLDIEISSLEKEKIQLENELSQGTLTNEELITKSNRISVVIHLIEEKTMRWLELSERMS